MRITIALQAAALALMAALALTGALACAGLAGSSASAASSARRDGRIHKANAAPQEYGCPILPAEDPLNQEIANAPVNPNSANYVASIGLSAHLHPDFGTNPSYGIPYTVVGKNSRRCRSGSSQYGAESEPGPLPGTRERADRGRWQEGTRRQARAGRAGRQLQAV